MKFNYQARTEEGEIQAGVVEASSKEAAFSLLQKYGLYVTYLEEAKPPFYARRIEIFQRVSPRDIVLFSRQLAIMFGSRVPLVEALRVLASQTRNMDLREKIINLAEEVEGGSAFSKALSLYPKVFSSFYIAMVKAGEASGKLAESLDYLANHLEREYHLSARTKGALLYPFLVLFVVVLVLYLMIFMVIPNLKMIIESSGMEVPKITQMVIGFSDLLRSSGHFLIIGFLVLSVLIYRYYKTKKGKAFFDKFFLKLPFFGPLLQAVNISRFAENLSTLIAGGLMITQALELTANTLGNSIYKKAILSARDGVKKGMPISSVLSIFPEIFPPVFIQMTMVGEKTGTLDTSLTHIANFYQKEVERNIENILNILEPGLIVVLGIIVGGLMFSVLMPFYQVITF
jgi:type IV pilus assembly protein PilC